MRRIMLFVVFIAMLTFCFPALADDKKKDDKSENDTEYDLTPKFKKGMKWKEEIEIQIITYMGKTTVTKNCDLKVEVEVSEIKDDMPTKLTFKNKGGKMKTTTKTEGNEDKEETKEIEESDFEANVKSDYRMSPPAGLLKLSAVFSYYPAGTLIGFALPDDKIKEKSIWESDTEIAIGYFHFDVSMDKPSDIESKFILYKVDESKTKSIATIKWKGSCMENTSFGSTKHSWKRTIEYDLKNKRMISTTGKVSSKDGDKGFEVSVSRKLKYNKK